jgi:D-alanyl-D-alanine carboxypeptidase
VKKTPPASIIVACLVLFLTMFLIAPIRIKQLLDDKLNHTKEAAAAIAVIDLTDFDQPENIADSAMTESATSAAPTTPTTPATPATISESVTITKPVTPIAEPLPEEQIPEPPKKIPAKTRAELIEIYSKKPCPSDSGDVSEIGTSTDQILVKVNRTTPLPDGYVPKHLSNISKYSIAPEFICLKREVAAYLGVMFESAARDNIKLGVVSAFRLPTEQGAIYQKWVAEKGDEGRERVAEPLHSEHQLGTAVDITSMVGNPDGSEYRIHGTPEDAWLKSNAHKYGFVMSYPEGKESITGYTYEPWHYRFVGIAPAREIFDKKISVQEYFDLMEQNKQ